MRGTPKSLFKYFSPDRLDVLLTRKVRFTPLGQFNDPFEGKPHLEGLATEEQTLASFEEVLIPELIDAYNKQPTAFRTSVSQDEFLKQMIPAMRQSYPDLQEEMKTELNKFLDAFPQKWNAHIGALCLSEVCDSLLMWAHYAASHTGFALEFDAHHPFFHAQRSESDELRHIRRVLYRDSRPSGLLVDLEASDMFLVKSNHWLYEREWRIFMALSEADVVADIDATKIYLFEIPTPAITGVILGARAPTQLREAVLESIRQQPGLSHVKIKSCHADPSEFALRVREGVS